MAKAQQASTKKIATNLTSGSRLSLKQLKAFELRQNAVRNTVIRQMRLQGISYAKIAKRFGISKQRVHRIVNESLTLEFDSSDEQASSKDMP